MDFRLLVDIVMQSSQCVQPKEPLLQSKAVAENGRDERLVLQRSLQLVLINLQRHLQQQTRDTKLNI